jgi:hypothetical protein
MLAMVSGNPELFAGDKKRLTSLQKRFLNTGLKDLGYSEIIELPSFISRDAPCGVSPSGRQGEAKIQDPEGVGGR